MKAKAEIACSTFKKERARRLLTAQIKFEEMYTLNCPHVVGCLFWYRHARACGENNRDVERLRRKPSGTS